MLPNSNMFKIINSILIFVAIILFALLANTFIRNQAIDQCAKSSTYEKNLVSEDAKVTYPVIDIYEQCLKQKGIK